MIRYRYNQQTDPPAPFVYGTFQNPADSTELRDVPAQIDTAADRTVLPDHLVQALGLAQMGRIAVGGLGGIVHGVAFLVELTFLNGRSKLAEEKVHAVLQYGE